MRLIVFEFAVYLEGAPSLCGEHRLPRAATEPPNALSVASGGAHDLTSSASMLLNIRFER
eukprot:639237-Rhodomonas_salina.1